MNHPRLLGLLGLLLALRLASHLSAAVFPSAPTETARIEVSDTTGGLGWNPAALVPAPNALTVACWVKLSMPGDVSLTGNMTILGNRRTGDWNQPHAYRFYYNYSSGNIEFSARGTTGPLTPIKLVERPFLDRWYHLCVVRSFNTYTVYVDGRQQLSPPAQDIGNAATTDGLTIGALAAEQRFWGEAQEVAVYQKILNKNEVVANMLRDIPANYTGLRGYFKLGYSTVASDNYKNFAASAPTGTEAALKQGTGTIDFPETDKQGEQSLFDSRKNAGRDAVASIGGAFGWTHSVFKRGTCGIPFDFQISYQSSIGFAGQQLEQGEDVYASDTVLGKGWRHSFQTRLVPGSLFLQGSTAYVGLLSWEGNLETWQRQTGTDTYKPVHGEYRGEMRVPAGGDFIEWITPDRLIFKFHHPTNSIDPLVAGKLSQIRDFNGNHLDLAYDPGDGSLLTVTDTAGGVWTFNYAGGRLGSVTGFGWSATFAYTTSPAGQTVLQSKTLSGPSTYTPVGNTQWRFEYNAQGLLHAVIDPRNHNDTRVTYDTYGRKTTVMDALGRTTRFDYNKPSLRQLTTTALHGTDAALNRVTVDTFDRKLHLLSRVDPLGYASHFKYDPSGNVTETTDARGVRTVMTYDARANVLTRTNGLGEKTTWEYLHVLADGITALNKPTREIRPATTETPAAGWENRYDYDGAGNLLRHRDGPVGGADAAMGTLATHVYGDPRGLVTSSRDANDNETRFTYDAATGFLATRTIAFGTPQAATWTITARTELGWPLAEKNPLNELTTSAYNLNGQVVSTTDALPRTFTKVYDPNGNLTSESDGKGSNFTTYVYNEANERTRRTDRAGKTWDYTYTPFGEPERTTAPEALSDGVLRRDSTVRVYDRNGRLVEERDPYYDPATPTLHRLAYEYDANGNQTAAVDKIGRRSERTYDALGRVVAERDPLGNIRRTAFDAAGRVSVITSPNGHPSTHAYDGRGRLTRWTDPEGFEWDYAYDGVGNILKITDALDGEYVMTYGPRNERLTETNQDNQTWTYTYDLLVRLKIQVNPPGTGAGPDGGPVTRTLAYDGAGRIDSIAFNTGRTDDYDFDKNNNLRYLARTQPGRPVTSLSLSYDAMDRLDESSDTFHQSVGYDYDALGRVTLKRYPGGKNLTQSYDRLGRLKKLSFAFSATPLDCTFAYDDADRLTNRTYPNGVTQTNTFDEAGRIASLSYAGAAAPPIALAYAYDHNGNKTGGSEAGTLAWKDSSLADYDDTTAFSPGGKLETRTDAAAAGGPRTFDYTYDATGNLTLASAPGESYALTYDEDNRTTAISWDQGLASTDIINRYDGLGRRVSRIYETTETRYVLDLIGGMERILCDTDATGAIQAWYIHGPDLSFRVSATGALTCYHADAMGNIVRTTNATGATRNQYAYTPYGRTIPVDGSTPDEDDPYQFVGSQGVMLELPALYFMRARYYSADAGVFFATDSVKNIGAGWKPSYYDYSGSNPSRFIDPKGAYLQAVGVAAKFVAHYWALEQTLGRQINAALSATELISGQLAGTLSEEEYSNTGLEITAEMAAASTQMGAITMDIIVAYNAYLAGYGSDQAKEAVIGALPGGQTWQGLRKTYNIIGNTSLIVTDKIIPNSIGAIKSSASRIRLGAASTTASSTTTPASVASAANSEQSTKAASPSSGRGSRSHTVRPGDTLGNIAYQNGTTATALGAANGIANLDLIRPGQTIIIPMSARSVEGRP